MRIVISILRSWNVYSTTPGIQTWRAAFLQQTALLDVLREEATLSEGTVVRSYKASPVGIGSRARLVTVTFKQVIAVSCVSA